MSSQESLITFIQKLELDDDSKYSEFQKMIEKKISSKKKTKKPDKKDISSEHCRDGVFEHDSNKKGARKSKVDTSFKHKGNIQIKQENPKKSGSKAWTRYESYKSATTYQEFRNLGGSSSDYTYDLGKGFITELNVNSEESSNTTLLDEDEEVKASKKSSDQELVDEQKIQEKKLSKNTNEDESTKKTVSIKRETSNVNGDLEEKISPEELNSHFESSLDKNMNEIVSKNNFENKRENISKIKKKLFEDDLIKDNFKKTDKTVSSLISSKYNELCLVYEKKCKEEFETMANEKDIQDREDETEDRDDETEEIEVSEINQEGVTYLLDPKSNLIYDSDTNEQIGKYREGIIIFD